MRRLVVFTLLTVALAVPAAGLAGPTGSDDGTLSVRNGYGKVGLGGKNGLQFDGSVVGRIALHGSIRVIDPFVNSGEGLQVWGYDERFDSGPLTVYTGDGLRFRASGGSYRLSVKGIGVNLSAVGYGTVTLDGAGNNPDIGFDGRFSINDAPYRSLPDYARAFDIAAPAGQ